MALTKKNKEEFPKITLKAKVRIHSRSNNLRRLQQDSSLSNDDLPISCNQIGKSDTAGGFNCLSDNEAKDTPLNIQLDTDDIDIAGIPDDIEPSELYYAKDYSNKDNLKTVDNLPNVTITNIDASNCEENGEYIIKGEFDNGNLNDASNVEIPFGYPDSCGLCDIKINNKEVTMKCQNKEKFDYSNILFEQINIHDSEGKDIFKLNNYTNIESFSCAISVNSISKKVEENNSTTIDNTNKYYNNQNNKSNSSGLSGGAIAGIVIAIIAVLVIIGVIFALVRNGIFSRKKIPPHSINSITENNGSNTLNKLYYNNTKNN
jgi:hypothetical protein